MTKSAKETAQEPLPRHVRIGLLLDLYGSLLTDRQREFVRLHYDEDQSFGEIAQGKGVSRQAVHDAVKHAERSLEQYERKMRLLERGIPAILDRIEQAPLPREGEAGEDEALPSEEWVIEALEREVPAGGTPNPPDGVAAISSRSGPAGRGDAKALLDPVAEGLVSIRKRILRSGGIIYDADGLLSEVNRLLARVNAMRGRPASGPGGPQDV